MLTVRKPWTLLETERRAGFLTSPRHIRLCDVRACQTGQGEEENSTGEHRIIEIPLRSHARVGHT